MPRRPPPAELVESLVRGDRRALARALSAVEEGGDDAREIGRLAHPHGGSAYTVGITGAPGAGKSTLTSALIGVVRAGGAGDEVSVLAIDPSSPFSGGAILGDRVRMQDHALDDGVFIRSMATRGHLGGLSLATPQAIRVLDAAGKPWVLVETVGVGQVEVEVAGKADTTIVVVNPGWGDAVQANKAGLLEIADIFVINKADRPGAAETRRDLTNMLEMTDQMGDWLPPILDTVAAKGEGVSELWDAVAQHKAHLSSTGGLSARREGRLSEELREIVARTLEARAYALTGDARVATLRDDIAARRIDPYDAADEIIGGLDG
ncbi:MAG TPA: methylmalonyl Co-A mutase-associated GTPase MeaB [Acidimicrobiales bacterium]|nr:methylmalonyl Co-A mutase-associated GTPase MeaB [Acidimicrobiales bacterium]